MELNLYKQHTETTNGRKTTNDASNALLRASVLMMVLLLCIAAFVCGTAGAADEYVNESGWWDSGGMFHVSGAPIHAALHVPMATRSIGTTAPYHEGSDIADINRGLDKNHPEFYSKVISERDFVKGDPITDARYGHGMYYTDMTASTGEASSGRYKRVTPGASVMNLSVEFNDIYADYGEDTDGDGLYDYLTVEIGVNVTEAGYYQIEGRLDESYGDYLGWAYNSTYLNAGSQTVQLDFSGMMIRQNGVNGTYDLSYLYLYDSSTGEQLDYINNAYTTAYYNYTEFQIPPAEFNDIYADYGEDTDGDGLYDYLTVEIGVNVTEAGYYQIEGRLDESYGDYLGWAYNSTYLNAGNQTVQLDFSGIAIRQNEVNGTYDLSYLSLYDSSTGDQLDYINNAYTTAYYNYTEFQIPPAEFSDVYSDYGKDIDGDGLYDYLTVEIGVDVIEAGNYQIGGRLDDSDGDYLGGAYNSTYLNAGSQTVQLDFSGMMIRQNGVNGTYDLSYLYLYDDDWDLCDYVYDAYTTSHYNYTEFQRPPAPPAIISWSNDKTNDDSLHITLNESESVCFNATADQTITAWNWFNNGVAQPDNNDYYTTSWSVNGTYTVSVNAANANGTSDTKMWTIIVGSCDYDPADTNQDCVVDMMELMAHISKWKSGEVGMMELMTSIGRWKLGTGGYC